MTEHQTPPRYDVICRDCDGIDTYGDESYAELGREHARTHPGHRVQMRVSYTLTVSVGWGDTDDA